jgi:hypothetical protein
MCCVAMGNSKKVCPDCGRNMVQQFIGVKHCKCGTSWEKDIGYFKRTSDMVFALQRQTIGKEIKQVPGIRYKETERKDDGIMEINEDNISAGAMFSPISIGDFLKAHKKNNPTEDIKAYRTALEQAVQAKKSGAVCSQCGSPIWAIGTATVGWNGCFTCITGEADSSEDYEIDSVCFK